VAIHSRSWSNSNFLRPQALLFVGTTIATIVLDQWTKKLATSYLLGPEGTGPRSVPVLGSYIRLTYVENRGAAFGLLQDQTTFFVLVGLVVIVVIFASYRQLERPGWGLNFCLGLQLGGALGNLMDRIRSGYVVDFVDLTFWPVFNVADSAICVGVGLLAWNLLFAKQHAEQSAEA
jgi:signal peptidase II